ncbi:hypothetical protein GCM10023149_14110 [Mucilaginibacter gynuensis]|uniref:Uncharacterized protein n=1 Tax=Mucilaginibacter gynuensis TaxID=1302236 RepID=A0ABP8G4A9_9SPHI
MPVQINELIIRTVVDPAPTNNGTQANTPTGGNEAELDAIEKVLEIIKEKKER